MTAGISSKVESVSDRVLEIVATVLFATSAVILVFGVLRIFGLPFT